jgi:hypothetical protein
MNQAELLREHVQRVMHLYNGKVPYVIFGEENMTKEEIKFAMWIQGMNDIIKQIELKR